MAADEGAAILETNNDDPKIPDVKKTKFRCDNYRSRTSRIHCRNLLLKSRL
jgi:hypothetical protein